LQDIFNYYKNQASLTIARKIVHNINDKSLSLKKFPNAGQAEE